MEIKAAANISAKHFTHLRWFKQKYSLPNFFGIVLHTGDQLIAFDEGLWAVPIPSIWKEHASN